VEFNFKKEGNLYIKQKRLTAIENNGVSRMLNIFTNCLNETTAAKHLYFPY